MHAPALFALSLCAAIGALLWWRSITRKPPGAQAELPELLQEQQQITDFLDSSDNLFVSEPEREFMEHRLAMVEHAIRRRRRPRPQAAAKVVPPPLPQAPAAPRARTRDALARASGDAGER